MLTQPPDISLVSGQTGTVDSGLLSGADTDCLTVLYIAYRIGLCIFQRNQRNQKVSSICLRNFLVVCYNIGKHSIIDFQEIVTLFKGNTEYLFPFQICRAISRINLNDIVGTLSLGL